MGSTLVKLRSIPETNAAVGWTGTHSVIVDRPEGTAGGMGLGFNGGQLLGLSIAGCFANDLHALARGRGVKLASVAIDVTVTFEGDPSLATGAQMNAWIETDDPAVDSARLVREAEQITTISNSLRRGFPVTITAGLSTAEVSP